VKHSLAPPIVAFGYHDRESPRHWSVCKALREDGYDIIECHTETQGLLGKYCDLWKKWRALQTTHYTLLTILVTFPGHALVPIAWLLTRFPRRKLLFDAFISLYDTNVCDRRRAPRWHPRAWLWYIVDFVSCHLADEVILDTEEHKKYFVKTFFLKPERVRVIYLQARPDLFFSEIRNPCLAGRQAKSEIRNSFEVLFYGSYIPLHGIEHILRAAAILQDRFPHIHFRIVGSGQEHPAMQALARELRLQNTTFLPSVPLSELPGLIRSADLCLGIFGTSSKAQRVIPHKVLDAVACGIPVITADTIAMRERFTDGKDVFLCKPGDPQDLARTILRIEHHRSV